MIRCECSTQWIGDGTEDNANRPKLGDDYDIHKFEDVTGQPSENLRPDPNNYIVLAEMEQSVLDLIAADSNYYIYWREQV